MNQKPAKSNLTTLHQIIKLIPGHLVGKLAAKHGIDKQARSFTPWSHVVTLLLAQLTHTIGLNDVCDSMRLREKKLSCIRGAKAPARNTLSHANKNRDPAMMKDLFWCVLSHLDGLVPGGFGTRYKGLPRKFRKTIHAVDSSTIALVANTMSWAKHRRRKAAAKLHLRLNLQSFLPSCAIIDAAKYHDETKAPELCAGLREGEVALFDKAYVHFQHLYNLTERGVFWVTRAKDNMAYEVEKSLDVPEGGKVLKDQMIRLTVEKSRKQYPASLRRVEMLVEVDGKERVMVFITNNTEWAASSVGALYKARWSIEVFFKQIKQTLQVCDFLGHSKNAIEWQLWAALLLYVLLRFQAQMSDWGHSFSRLIAVARSVVWERFDLMALLKSYGTAAGPKRTRASCEAMYLPGFAP